MIQSNKSDTGARVDAKRFLVTLVYEDFSRFRAICRIIHFLTLVFEDE